MSGLIQEYFGLLSATGRSPATIRTYRAHLNQFSKWAKQAYGHCNWLEIDEAAIQSYVDYLQDLSLVESSINDELRVLKAYYSQLVSGGRMNYNPAAGVPFIDEPITGPRILTKAESFVLDRALLEMKNRRNACIVLTMKLAGLRTSEVIVLKPDDVVITQGKGFLVIRGTTFRRTVPMCKVLTHELGSYLHKERSLSKWLFPSYDEEPLTTRGVQHLVTILGNQLNIKGLTAQSLRNSYSKKLLDFGIHPDEVARLIGVARLNPRLLPGTGGGGERP